MRNLIVLGAGLKVDQTCDLFNLWDRIVQFYEKPRQERELRRGIGIYYDLSSRNLDRVYEVVAMLGDCRDKRRAVTDFTIAAKEAGLQYRWGQLRHPQTLDMNPKHIGVDFICRPYSLLCSQIEIGDHVDVGNLCNVAHNSILGNYTILGGQVAMSGSVVCGEGVFVGQGVSIKPGIRIGDGAVIGTGAVVVKDVPPNTVVAGNPAKTNKKFKPVTPW